MIKILDSFVADKIAAGEVIERPLSIIKELVENSVDAGASSVIVEIRNGGKSYIRVTDDGCGIPSGEVRTAFERHATGKIEKITDLDNITTLGFRGEALASIAAISRVTMYTKTEEQSAGTKTVIHGGRIVSEEITGMNRGTTMVVEDVFYNTPARRKFMRTDAAEASAVIELIQKLAIYYAAISFKMINNGQNIFVTAGDSDILGAITTVYPGKEYRELIKVEHGCVSGYVSDPGTTKSSRRGQIFFVNGRIVSSDVIEKGISSGYGDRVFSGFPLAILFIDVDPSAIDVNIHPNKKEIKFLDARSVSDDVAAAIKDILFSSNAVPGALHGEYRGKDTEADIEDEKISLSEQQDLKTYLSEKRMQAAEPDKHAETDVKRDEKDTVCKSISHDNRDIIKEEKTGIAIDRAEVVPFDFAEISVIGYVFDTYIVTMARDELFVLDQHAAHERILYERMVQRYESDDHLSQPILIPFTIETSGDVYNGDREWMKQLERFGYDISDFGGGAFMIREIPEYMSQSEAEIFARTFMDGYENGNDRNSVVIDKLITRSCKSAVKANDHLSEREIDDLLSQLSECINPFSCPHGRPTFIKITKYDIERAFRRK